MFAETMGQWGAAVRGLGVMLSEFRSQSELAYTPDWAPIVKNRKGTAAAENVSGKTGIGVLEQFAEGTAVPRANRYKLYTTTFNQKQYGKQIEVSRQNLLYRDFQSAFDEARDLSQASKILKSKAPAQIFNGAFTSGSFNKNGVWTVTYNDGKALASTVHPRVDGGTAQSNASSTGIALTEANFETGRIALSDQLYDDGQPIVITGTLTLLVPIALEKTALIIVGSS